MRMETNGGIVYNRERIKARNRVPNQRPGRFWEVNVGWNESMLIFLGIVWQS